MTVGQYSSQTCVRSLTRATGVTLGQYSSQTCVRSLTSALHSSSSFALLSSFHNSSSFTYDYLTTINRNLEQLQYALRIRPAFNTHYAFVLRFFRSEEFFDLSRTKFFPPNPNRIDSLQSNYFINKVLLCTTTYFIPHSDNDDDL